MFGTVISFFSVLLCVAAELLLFDFDHTHNKFNNIAKRETFSINNTSSKIRNLILIPT